MESEKKEIEIKASIIDGSFSVSGSIEQIDKYLPKLMEFVSENKIATKKLEEKKIISNDSEIDSINLNKTNNKSKYEEAGIYTYKPETEEIFISTKVPGKNNAEKTKNVALIYLYAMNYETEGLKAVVKGSSIKEICKQQGCLDAPNFSKVFKRDFTNFIKDGKGQSWTLQLNINGERNAQLLLDEMLNEKN